MTEIFSRLFIFFIGLCKCVFIVALDSSIPQMQTLLLKKSFYANIKKMINKYCITGAATSLIISILFGNTALAYNSGFTVSLQGAVSITGSGAWGSGISLSGTVHPNQTSIAGWSADNNFDYMTLVDTAASPGAYIEIYAMNQKFSYSGQGRENTGLVVAENMYFETNGSPSSGQNDNSKNINLVTSESCSLAGTSQFSFNTDFYQAGQGNRLRMAAGLSNRKLLFRSSTTCTSTVKLFFNSIKLYLPRTTTSGSYSNSFIFIVVDGQP